MRQPQLGEIVHLESSHIDPRARNACFAAIVVRSDKATDMIVLHVFIPSTHEIALAHYPIAAATLYMRDPKPEWHYGESCPDA